MKNFDAFKQHGDVIWNIANLLRGPYRPPQYRRVMIPLTVLRRLDCVLEETKDDVIAMHKKLKGGEGKYDAETIEKIITQKFKVTVLTTPASSPSRSCSATPTSSPPISSTSWPGSPPVRGRSSRSSSSTKRSRSWRRRTDSLKSSSRSPPWTCTRTPIPNIAMGYVFEDLVRRFNEQANEEAGDHFTPREVIKLMVNLLFTYDDLVYKEGKVIKIYDPTAGTGGMLSESEKLIVDPETGLNPSANLELFGQEYNPESYAICGSDLMIKGEDVKNIVFGNTLGTGKAKEGFVDGDGHPDEQFHYMLANPPFGVEWKPEKDHVTKEHNEFGFKGRFGPGLPRINDGALLFLLHMISKMEPAPDDGGEGSRIGIVFNGSPLFTGDAGSGESNIRRWIIENDMLEAVIGLPDQLFYNTGISTYVWIVTNRKAQAAPGQGAAHQRHRLRVEDEEEPRRQTQTHRRRHRGHAEPHRGAHQALWRLRARCPPDRGRDSDERGPQARPDQEPLRQQDFRQPGLRLSQDHRRAPAAAEFRRHRRAHRPFQADQRLRRTRHLPEAEGQEEDHRGGTGGRGSAGGHSRSARWHEGRVCRRAARQRPRRLRRTTRRRFRGGGHHARCQSPQGALLAPGSLGERDPSAEICRDKKGNPEPDPELRDTENVPFPPGIALPLPLDYEGKKNKGKVDVEPLLALVRDHCEAYLAAEVLPYRPDAWIDHSKIKVGYEIPFNRHFYEYEAPRPLDKIEKDIGELGEGNHGDAEGGHVMKLSRLSRNARNSGFQGLGELPRHGK